MVDDGWAGERGVVRLPGGGLVRGRRLDDAASSADFTLVLAEGPLPPWPHRRIRWPDFWIPTDTDDALEALREAHRRATAGERGEVACHGGAGRRRGGGALPRGSGPDRDGARRARRPPRTGSPGRRPVGPGRLSPAGGR